MGCRIILDIFLAHYLPPTRWGLGVPAKCCCNNLISALDTITVLTSLLLLDWECYEDRSLVCSVHCCIPGPAQSPTHTHPLTRTCWVKEWMLGWLVEGGDGEDRDQARLTRARTSIGWCCPLPLNVFAADLYSNAWRMRGELWRDLRLVGGVAVLGCIFLPPEGWEPALGKSYLGGEVSPALFLACLCLSWAHVVGLLVLALV